MNLKNVYTVGLGCLTLLALSAGGQAATGNPSPAATDQGTATATAPTGESAGKPKTATASTHKHHAPPHHAAHTKHQAATSGNQETAYRTALKSCVAGPAGQRDRCLDDAIARYARS